MSARLEPGSADWLSQLYATVRDGERYARHFGYQCDELDGVSDASRDAVFMFVGCAVNLYLDRHHHLPADLDDAIVEMARLDRGLTARLQLTMAVAAALFDPQTTRSSASSPTQPLKDNSHDA